MKKLLCIIMALVILCSFAACGKEAEKKVTIYIPDAITVYDQTGAVYASITYVFEDGWETKESFTVTMSGDTDKLGGSGTTVYGDKCVSQDVSNGAKLEMQYDENGRETLMINRYADGGRREVTYTYDASGRVTAETQKMYESAEAEPVTTVTEYTYTDTDTGSTTTVEMGNQTVTTTYDRNGRMLSQVSMVGETELSRTEVTYDAAGNMIGQISYFNGQKNMEMKYTFKTAEVSQETAARLPQFKTAK